MPGKFEKKRKGRAVAVLAALVCFAAAVFLLQPMGAPMQNPGADAALGATAQGASSLASGSAEARDSRSSAAAESPSAKAQDLTGSQERASADAAVLEDENGAEYRAGELVAKLVEPLESQDALARIARLAPAGAAPSALELLGDGWAKLSFPEGADIDAAARALKSAGLVEEAQHNFVYRLLDEPAAPQAAGVDAALQAVSLLGGTDDPYGSAWHLQAIGAYDAWKTRKVNRAVTVAVMDSGCQVSHKDLKKNIVAKYNAVNGGKNVEDLDGHGTHVAGIIAAVPNNGIGVAGVSYNAGILPIKVIDDDTTSTAVLVKAYRYVMDNASKYDIRVVNVSLGGKAKKIGKYDVATLRAMDKAYRAGILTVCSAGNDTGESPYYCFPCDYSETGVGVINVGRNYASGRNDSSSNYNVGREMTKDISAPGVSIPSTFPGNDYTSMTGTSMAAPVVAGVAALVFAKNPKLSAGEAKSVLCSTAQDLTADSGSSRVGFDAYTGYGLVRADKAVAGASNAYIKGADGLAVGKTIKLSVPRSGTWTWSSSNKSVAKVDKTTGMVTGISRGEAAITARSGGVTLRRTVVVYKLSFKGRSTLAVGSKATMASSVSPVAVPKWSSSNPAVASVGSTSGVVTAKKAGKAKITMKLAGFPGVKVSKTVTVKAASLSKAKVKLSRTSFTYNGRARAPKVEYVKVGAVKLKRGTDYRVSYSSGRKAAGTYKVAIKAKGASFKGKITKKFKVKRAANPLSVKAKAATVAHSKLLRASQRIKGAFVFKKKAKGAITYEKVDGASSSRLTVNPKSGDISVKHGTVRGTHALKVRVKAAGTKNYRPKTQTLTVKVRVV